MQRIDVRDRDNNFYIVRIFLASRVIFGHAFVLAGAPDLLGKVYASLGVNGFFVISGFLVTRSLASSKSMMDYTAARAFRILPALWAMLFVTVPLVLMFGMDRPLSSGTLVSATEYIVRNMLVIPTTYEISGVFEGMPLSAVNGSLWNLRFELVCYALLGLLALVGILRRPLIAVVIALLLGAVYVTGIDADQHLMLQRFDRLTSLFFFGCALSLYAERIVVSVPLGLALTLIAVVIGRLAGNYGIVSFAFGYLILSVAYSKAGWFKKVNKAVELRRIGKPDLSYGIYLYAFPIQQLLYFNQITPDPWSNIAVTIVLAMGCAYLSSTFVEKPATRIRDMLTARHATGLFPRRQTETGGES